MEPPGGDQHRRWGAIVPNEGKRFQSLNRNKRGIAIDLRPTRRSGPRAAARAALRRGDAEPAARGGGALRAGLRDAARAAPGPRLLRDHGLGPRRPAQRPHRDGPDDDRLRRPDRRRREDRRRGRTAAPRRLGAGGLLGGLLRRGGHPGGALPPRAHGRGPARRGLAAARLTRDSGHRGDARASQRRADARPDDRGGARDPRPRRQLRGDPRCAGGAAAVGHGGAARLQPRLPDHRRPDHARRDHAPHARPRARGAGRSRTTTPTTRTTTPRSRRASPTATRAWPT